MDLIVANRVKFIIFFLLVGTNLITYLYFTGGSNCERGLDELHSMKLTIENGRNPNMSFVPTNAFNSKDMKLVRTLEVLNDVERDLNKAMDNFHITLKTMTKAMIPTHEGMHSNISESNNINNTNVGSIKHPWALVLADLKEFQEFIEPRSLPLGWSSSLASNSIASPVGHLCSLHSKLLRHYTETYHVGDICPDDQGLAQHLLLHGCEPLPRRRCFARSPKKFEDPFPIPKCFWSKPPNNNILWTNYSCNSFECLNGRNKKHIVKDCLDCFDLNGREKRRWIGVGSPLDFTIGEVLNLKNGTIRIGLDIGGGTGTFAVRMKENDVTIVTTTMNLDGPFNNMVALRGVIPLHISITQRFPFFDNTLDIVHSMHVLSNWIPTETLEFLLFDIDRILRPGGLFWLDHFFCLEFELTRTYIPLIEKLGYRKLKWAIGNKLDNREKDHEVYLSAVLEKPYSR